MKFRDILRRVIFPLGAENAALWGDFGLQVFDHSTGVPQRKLRIRKKNQITNQGRIALLNLMRPGPYATAADPTDAAVQLENRVWSLAVGTNNTPPTINDDDTTMSQAWISSFFFPVPSGGSECTIVATPPNSYYLSVSKTLATGDANGYTLTEAGIFTRGDNDNPSSAVGQSLYARQIHSPIIKTSSMSIQYDWQLGITIQS